MTVLYGDRTAFGAPGVTPRWTRSAKEGVGTAYSASSRVWFTLSHGILNEIYYPRIDRPQIRDMEYLITDGESFFHEEKRHLTSEIEQLNPTALGYRIVNSDPEGRYRIIKEIISDPHLPCVLVHTRVEAAAELRRKLRLFALLAPHLDVGGAHNNGHVAEVAGQDILVAYKENTWLALGADIPFLQRSCGYVGTSDGWTDLASDLKLDWKFDVACDGNIALIGELDVMKTETFTLGIGFGDGLHAAATTLFQSLGVPYEEQRARFIEQWGRSDSHRLPLAPLTGDDGKLFHTSHSLLLAHEDKTFQGALIASLSIPWGEVKGDDELGGYHLVWTRDMVNSAGGLVAAGHLGTAFRALIYLASTQLPDGGFHQNFWLDGSPYWTGVQLDEVSFPILLAWRLHHHGALDGFDPYPMVVRAAGYLIRHGPATPQERWEENSGYSPSTLAAGITALNCAAGFAQLRGDAATARFIQEYADFLEAHIEAWTVTTQGTLVPGIPRHFIRINPVDPSEPHPDEDPNTGLVPIRNRPPGAQIEFPAKEIVDQGFLELVRYGVRRADDPLIVDSVKVIDAVLKVETPFGPCWRRYNHDGYGQRDDGSPFEMWGVGRAWPLLTGERGTYELAAGRDPAPYLRAMERFATHTGLLAEQIWDADDKPECHMFKGRPTGSAMPLMWAHAEYLKLLRSAKDGCVFDRIDAVADRYLQNPPRPRLEVWKFNRRIRRLSAPNTLRIVAQDRFRLRWSADEWQTVHDDDSRHIPIGLDTFDIEVPAGQRAPIRFTFYWPDACRWEGRDFQVEIVQ